MLNYTPLINYDVCFPSYLGQRLLFYWTWCMVTYYYASLNSGERVDCGVSIHKTLINWQNFSDLCHFVLVYRIKFSTKQRNRYYLLSSLLGKAVIVQYRIVVGMTIFLLQIAKNITFKIWWLLRGVLYSSLFHKGSYEIWRAPIKYPKFKMFGTLVYMWYLILVLL